MLKCRNLIIFVFLFVLVLAPSCAFAFGDVMADDVNEQMKKEKGIVDAPQMESFSSERLYFVVKAASFSFLQKVSVANSKAAPIFCGAVATLLLTLAILGFGLGKQIPLMQIALTIALLTPISFLASTPSVANNLFFQKALDIDYSIINEIAKLSNGVMDYGYDAQSAFFQEAVSIAYDGQELAEYKKKLNDPCAAFFRILDSYFGKVCSLCGKMISMSSSWSVLEVVITFLACFAIVVIYGYVHVYYLMTVCTATVMIALALCFFPYLCVFAAFATTRSAFWGLIKFLIENILMVLVTSIVVIFTMYGLSNSIDLLYSNTEKGSNILSANYAYVIVWALLCSVMMSRANDFVGRIMSMRPGPNSMGAAVAASAVAMGGIRNTTKAEWAVAKKGGALARKGGANYLQKNFPSAYKGAVSDMNSVKSMLYTGKGLNPYADATKVKNPKERAAMLREQVKRRYSHEPNQYAEVAKMEERNANMKAGFNDAQKPESSFHPNKNDMQSVAKNRVSSRDIEMKGARIRSNRWNKKG